MSRDGSNKATIAAFLAQQARSFEISLLRARNQKKIPDHRLENRDTDGGRKEAQFPVVRQAMEKDSMIKDFNVSFCCAAFGRYWHFATHSAAIKSRPLWRRTGNERTHGLSHLDAICLALDLTVPNVVHPSTVHRQHLRRNPT